MSTPDIESFDEWYRSIEASTRWDPFMQKALGLPPDLRSTGYLTGVGLAEVVERLQLAPGEALVELGCGRGGYGMAVVRTTGARLVGVDFSEVALAAAREQAARLQLGDRVAFTAGDLTATGLPASSADAVLCLDAVQFARPVAAAVTECRRLLRRAGRLVLTTWKPVVPGDPLLPERLRDLDVAADVEAAGFADVREDVRPDWSTVEREVWEVASELPVDGDPAVADLVDEARELLPLADRLTRVLVTARSPDR